MAFLLVGLCVGSAALGSLLSLWREYRRARSNARTSGDASSRFAAGIPALRFLTVATSVWIGICLWGSWQQGLIANQWAAIATATVIPGLATFVTQSWVRSTSSKRASEKS